MLINAIPIIIKIIGIFTLTLFSGVSFDYWLELLIKKEKSKTRYAYLVVVMLSIMLVIAIIKSF